MQILCCVALSVSPMKHCPGVALSAQCCCLGAVMHPNHVHAITMATSNNITYIMQTLDVVSVQRRGNRNHGDWLRTGNHIPAVSIATVTMGVSIQCYILDDTAVCILNVGHIEQTGHDFIQLNTHKYTHTHIHTGNRYIV